MLSYCAILDPQLTLSHFLLFCALTKQSWLMNPFIHFLLIPWHALIQLQIFFMSFKFNSSCRSFLVLFTFGCWHSSNPWEYWGHLKQVAPAPVFHLFIWMCILSLDFLFYLFFRFTCWYSLAFLLRLIFLFVVYLI